MFLKHIIKICFSTHFVPILWEEKGTKKLFLRVYMKTILLASANFSLDFNSLKSIEIFLKL